MIKAVDDEWWMEYIDTPVKTKALKRSLKIVKYGRLKRLARRGIKVETNFVPRIPHKRLHQIR